MPSNLVIADTRLFGTSGVFCCCSRNSESVLGIDRNGRLSYANVRIAKSNRASKQVFLGTKVCFGFFSEHTSLLTVSGRELDVDQMVDPRTRDDFRFEAPLVSLPPISIADDQIDTLVSIMIRDRLKTGTSILAPIRDPKITELAFLGEVVRTKSRAYLMLSASSLGVLLRKGDKHSIMKIVAALYAGIEPNEILFEIGEQAVAMAYMCKAGDFRTNAVVYDNRQHSCTLMLRPEPHADIHMKLGCSFLFGGIVNEYVIAWNEQGWAPILNGWISGKGSLDSERAAAAAKLTTS